MQCLFILWKEIGKRMGIQDIPLTVEDLREWSQNYEIQHMVPSEASRQLAQIAMDSIRRRVPNIPGLRRLVSSLFICLMDERLRNAMMCATPTFTLEFTIHRLIYQATGTTCLGPLDCEFLLQHQSHDYQTLVSSTPQTASLCSTEEPSQRH